VFRCNCPFASVDLNEVFGVRIWRGWRSVPRGCASYWHCSHCTRQRSTIIPVPSRRRSARFVPPLDLLLRSPLPKQHMLSLCRSPCLCWSRFQSSINAFPSLPSRFAHLPKAKVSAESTNPYSIQSVSLLSFWEESCWLLTRSRFARLWS
jgi:hypothetical protein